jgi:ribokinase
MGKMRTKWFYLSSMLGKGFEMQKKLVKWAKKNNVKVAYNISGYLAKKGLRYLKSVLNGVDVLILNKEESEMLVGKSRTLEKLGKIINVVCVTDGPRGAVARDNLGDVYSVKTSGAKCVEATGAGDAFACGFVAGLVKGKTIGESLQVGAANAESVIGYKGAKNKLLSWREAISDIKRKKLKVVEK